MSTKLSRFLDWPIPIAPKIRKVGRKESLIKSKKKKLRELEKIERLKMLIEQELILPSLTDYEDYGPHGNTVSPEGYPLEYHFRREGYIYSKLKLEHQVDQMGMSDDDDQEEDDMSCDESTGMENDDNHGGHGTEHKDRRAPVENHNNNNDTAHSADVTIKVKEPYNVAARPEVITIGNQVFIEGTDPSTMPNPIANHFNGGHPVSANTFHDGVEHREVITHPVGTTIDVNKLCNSDPPLSITKISTTAIFKATSRSSNAIINSNEYRNVNAHPVGTTTYANNHRNAVPPSTISDNDSNNTFKNAEHTVNAFTNVNEHHNFTAFHDTTTTNANEYRKVTHQVGVTTVNNDHRNAVPPSTITNYYSNQTFKNAAHTVNAFTNVNEHQNITRLQDITTNYANDHRSAVPRLTITDYDSNKTFRNAAHTVNTFTNINEHHNITALQDSTTTNANEHRKVIAHQVGTTTYANEQSNADPRSTITDYDSNQTFKNAAHTVNAFTNVNEHHNITALQDSTTTNANEHRKVIAHHVGTTINAQQSHKVIALASTTNYDTMKVRKSSTHTLNTAIYANEPWNNTAHSTTNNFDTTSQNTTTIAARDAGNNIAHPIITIDGTIPPPVITIDDSSPNNVTTPQDIITINDDDDDDDIKSLMDFLDVGEIDVNDEFVSEIGAIDLNNPLPMDQVDDGVAGDDMGGDFEGWEHGGIGAVVTGAAARGSGIQTGVAYGYQGTINANANGRANGVRAIVHTNAMNFQQAKTFYLRNYRDQCLPGFDFSGFLFNPNATKTIVPQVVRPCQTRVCHFYKRHEKRTNALPYSKLGKSTQKWWESILKIFADRQRDEANDGLIVVRERRRNNCFS